MDAECRNLEGSTSWRAADVAAWGASQQQKRQRCQAMLMQVSGSIGSASDFDISEGHSDHKNKQIMDNGMDWQKKVKGSSSRDFVGSSTNNSLRMSEPELQDFDSGENEEEDYNGENEEDCGDDDEEYEYDFDGDDFNQYLADKFDDLDLPPGVEATVPWLQKLASSDGPGEFKSRVEIEDEITKKYKSFKQFDTVEDVSDHHFAAKLVGKTGREWAKRIQHDWKLLEKDLPASIFVRVYEDRMDLLRAVIIGPAGTPYHDGLFFFDAHFPAAYPNVPPLVHYHAGGLRLNPNLYACGKVCLSLLGTWSGQGCEKWNSTHSTMLQVLISIQALVLNEKPYFNEPGYESYANNPTGQRSSLEYNDSTFLLSCKTMLYSLRNPPKHFEDLVAGHFRERGRTILSACKAYMEGIKVGSIIPEEEDEDKQGSSSSGTEKQEENTPNCARHHGRAFKPGLEKLFEELLMEFTVKGADTRKFLDAKVKKNEAADDGEA